MLMMLLIVTAVSISLAIAISWYLSSRLTRPVIEMTDGAMFQGPPNATAMWRDYTDQRQPGTPEHLPVYDAGTHLRWANQPSDLSQPPTPFRAPRAVYLQNASDPVVWWSPDVLWNQHRG